MNVMICIVCIFIDHIYLCTCAHMYPVRAGLHIHIIHNFQGSLVYLVASLVTGLYTHSSWNNIYIMYSMGISGS